MSINSTTAAAPKRDLATLLERIDRRFVYILVVIALAAPIIFKLSLPPAEMKTATAFYDAVDGLGKLSPANDSSPVDQKQIVFIALDWSANTQAENKPQTEVAIEHLMRKRIPFALVSLLQYAAPFMERLPKEIAERLMKENPNERWEYGKDWVNFGYQPNEFIFLQKIAKTKELSKAIPTDTYGTPYEDIPALRGIKTIKDVSMLMEFTGSVGTFNRWLQFFQTDGYRPPFVHGCTSITIPEAFSYFSSKQIVGLHEGAAGAAWYEKLLNDHYPNRLPGTAIHTMSGLAVAQLLIVGLIILGNIGFITQRFQGER